jgi:hypothetical protein
MGNCITSKSELTKKKNKNKGNNKKVIRQSVASYPSIEDVLQKNILKEKVKAKVELRRA